MSLNKEGRVPDIDRTKNVALFVRRAVRVVFMVLGRRMVGWAGPAVGPVISMARVKDLHHILHENSYPANKLKRNRGFDAKREKNRL